MKSDDDTKYEIGMCREWGGACEEDRLAAKALGMFDGWLIEGLSVGDVKSIVLDISHKFRVLRAGVKP